MTDLSSIETLINVYNQQVKEEELAREKAMNDAVAETEKQIRDLFGEEVWSELKPYVSKCIEWKNGKPDVSLGQLNWNESN